MKDCTLFTDESQSKFLKSYYQPIKNRHKANYDVMQRIENGESMWGETTSLWGEEDELF